MKKDLLNGNLACCLSFWPLFSLTALCFHVSFHPFFSALLFLSSASFSPVHPNSCHLSFCCFQVQLWNVCTLLTNQFLSFSYSELDIFENEKWLSSGSADHTQKMIIDLLECQLLQISVCFYWPALQGAKEIMDGRENDSSEYSLFQDVWKKKGRRKYKRASLRSHQHLKVR